MDLNVRSGTLRKSLESHAEGSFELTTMFHVLEHFADPVGALKMVGRSLKEGSGTLYVEVPNARGFCSPGYMFFRAHTLYFAPGSLQNLLQYAGIDVRCFNAPRAGNIRTAGTYRPGRQPQAARVARGHELVVAQERRRWGPYLLHQVGKGLFGKLARRVLENNAARRFESPQVLMESLYGRGAQVQRSPGGR